MKNEYLQVKKWTKTKSEKTVPTSFKQCVKDFVPNERSNRTSSTKFKDIYVTNIFYITTSYEMIFSRSVSSYYNNGLLEN